MVDVRQLPPEWETLAENKGIPASAREIGVAAGVATTTITRLVFDGRTSGETVRKVAAALGVDQARIFELAKLASHSELGPWDPPKEAHQLGAATRQALDRLIVAMAKEGGQAWGGNSGPEEGDGGPGVLRPGVDPPSNPFSGGAAVTPLPPGLPDNLEELAADAQEQALDVDRNPELKRQAEAGEEDQDERGQDG